MLKTKIYHVMEPKRLRCTIALEVPAKQDLVRLMNDFFVGANDSFYNGKLGIALVNPNDKFYVKKTGAAVAEKNAKEIKFSLVAIERFKAGTVFKFIVPIHNYMEVNLFIQPKNSVTYIQYINVAKIKRK